MPITPSSFKQGPKTLRENYQDRRRRVGLGTQRNCLMWGYNQYGQLGINDIIPRSSPIFIPGDKWVHVASSSYETWGVQSDGTLWAWGYNSYGQLGQNNLVYYSSPVQVGTDEDWGDLEYIEYNGPNQWGLFKKQDGTYWAQGYNGHGQLGQGDTVPRSSPVQVSAIDGKEWDTITISSNTIVAIAKTDQTLWGWGYNAHGALGVQGSTYLRSYSTPIQIDSNQWLDVALGTHTTVGVKTDGTLWTMGYNNHGQLGTNDTVPRSSPTQIGTQTDWQKVTCEYNHSAGTRTGNLYTWGYNAYGNLGLNDTTPRSSPNFANYSHTNGMIKDVRAISNRTYMQVGVATITGQTQWYGCGHDSSYQNLMDGMRSEGTGDIPRSSPVPVGPYWSDFIYNDNDSALDFADYEFYPYVNTTVAYNKAQ